MAFKLKFFHLVLAEDTVTCYKTNQTCCFCLQKDILHNICGAGEVTQRKVEQIEVTLTK